VVRRALRAARPDVIISFMDKTNVLALLATRGLRVPVMVSERSDPSHNKIGSIWRFLRRLTYPLADVLICQSTAALAYYDSFMATKGCVIPNPLIGPPMISAMKGDFGLQRNSRRVVAMGALVVHKGFDLLIEAFGSVKLKYPDWSLTILGEGPLRRELEKKVDGLGLSGRVRLPGQVADPLSELRTADLFVLSSRFEGFPNALLEAMACGLPVISFNCPSGPSEIIRDGVDGVLIPPQDVKALAAALDRLMGDKIERGRLASRAPEVLDRYNVSQVMNKWDALLARFNERGNPKLDLPKAEIGVSSQ
jgi:GalNAc-alpha-(1->4)-GalNAc-alpha-(1->3)-diNAcBac-PP-undecaprenol alpha-1,4-N-acetyl-D-galactosaminyltransferase